MKDFEFLADKHLYAFGECVAKVSGTINHRVGYSTVTRYENKQIVGQWQAQTIKHNEVDNAMRVLLMLPFSKGPKLESEWIDINAQLK